jgi:hypothetical protein
MCTNQRNELSRIQRVVLLGIASLSLAWMACTPPTPPARETSEGTPPPAPSQERPMSEEASPTPSAETAERESSPTRAPRARVTSSGSSTGAPASSAMPASGPKSPPVTAVAPAAPRTFTLAAGHSLSAWTSTELSTKTAQEGDRFEASLANAIVDEDWVIARKGAAVEGVVVSTDPGGRVSGVASLAVKLTHLTLADGRRVALSTSNFTREAKTTKGKDAAKIGVGAGVGAAIGAIAGGKKGAAIGAGAGGAAGTGAVLATRGDAAVIAAESQITVRLLSEVTFSQK